MDEYVRMEMNIWILRFNAEVRVEDERRNQIPIPITNLKWTLCHEMVVPPRRAYLAVDQDRLFSAGGPGELHGVKTGVNGIWITGHGHRHEGVEGSGQIAQLYSWAISNSLMLAYKVMTFSL
ncbi:hypothetical protein OUZ56_023509 [Daphnia magna]|uniref:Uncharacterized protein n=1 Tax=Daphnia magna TaxID=35525 RepID=A0ABR0AZ94_9CRUS|nr:hypothetical protein OUZ56_023509 [Daphnia magna]